MRVEILTGQSQAALTTPADLNAAHRSLVFPAVESAARFHAVRIVNPGEGIPREYLPRLTERFYRAPGQKSGDTSGTGLGLAIVKHIVNRHRGAMTIDSEIGKGSVFTVFLPPASPGAAAMRAAS